MRPPTKCAAILLLVVALCGCSQSPRNGPSIQITDIPPADQGGVIKLDVIKGRVTGAQTGQVVVLYARSGAWYVQPWADQPFTNIASDATWSNQTHLGTEYAALLVERDYQPARVTIDLPNAGNGVIGIVIVDGRPPFWRLCC